MAVFVIQALRRLKQSTGFQLSEGTVFEEQAVHAKKKAVQGEIRVAGEEDLAECLCAESDGSRRRRLC